MGASPPAEITHYIAPEESAFPGSLARYLQPLPANVLEAYIEAYTAEGDVVLDPFARTDAVARAAARLGRKAILSDLNPLATFVAKTTLLPVTGLDLQSALSALAAVRQADTPLAAHLDALYGTTCPRCGREAVATEFIWERRFDGPVAKRCLCPSCHLGQNGEAELAPVTPADLGHLRQVQPRGFHYWFLVDRLARGGEGYREVAEQMLDLYTPRNAYALATLLRHLEGSSFGANVESVLKLALLDCLCACSKLEAIEPSPRRRSDPEIDLRPPARFRERNVWRHFLQACAAIKQQIELRAAESSPPRLAASLERMLRPSTYARLGSPANTVVLQQPARQLKRELPTGSVAMVVCEPPGPGHGTFLCLSYLWAGWLFGSERVQAIEQVPCSARPVDWSAYYRAMTVALRGLLPSLKDDARLLLLFEAEGLRQLDMLVLAGIAGGLRLERVLCQAAGHSWSAEGVVRYQVELRKPTVDQAADGVAPGMGRPTAFEAGLRQEIEQALRDVLALRAEPTPSLWLHVAVLERLGRSGLLLELLSANHFDAAVVAETLSREINEALERGKRRRSIVQLEGRAPAWLLAGPAEGAPALVDRVEWAVYNLLSTSRATTTQNALRVIYGLFPGPCTPEAGLVEECLASYGQLRGDGTWALADRERLSRRLNDHAETIAALVALGRRFGYKVWIGREEQKRPHGGGNLGQLLTTFERFASPATLFGGAQAAEVDVIWYDEAAAVWLFEVEWTAMLSLPVVVRRLATKARRHLVLADEREPLVAAKLQRAPWLAQWIKQDGWRFIMRGRLLALAGSAEVSPADVAAIAGLKPVGDKAQVQLNLI